MTLPRGNGTINESKRLHNGVKQMGAEETGQRIIDAAMALVRDQGYTATTTKDIARVAGVNECTLFRKFQSKKDIVLRGMEQEKWRAGITPEVFQHVRWDLRADLAMFMSSYMERVTPDFVNLSIGLRAPQIYEDTAPLIMKIPETFLSALTDYFEQMARKGKIAQTDFESLAMTFFSATFGYTFLSASFGAKLTGVQQRKYIENSVKVFVEGIPTP